MRRVIILLVGLELGGAWLLASTLGFKPALALGVTACILAILVAIFILLKRWPNWD
jgi:hypothetical protein